MATARKLPSGNWRVRAYAGKGTDGKNKYVSFTAETKREAERMASSFEQDKERKIQNRMTLGEAMDAFIDTCRSQGYSPATVPDYVYRRKNSFTSIINLPVSKITESDVQQCMNDRAKDVSPKTVRNDYYLLKKTLSIYAPSLRLDHITLSRKKTKRKQVFSESWASSILSLAKQSGDMDFYLYCCFIISTGMRQSEIFSLKWGDISAGPTSITTADGNTYKLGTIRVNKARVKNEHRQYEAKDTKTEAGVRDLSVDWAFFESLYSIRPRGADDEYIITLKPNLLSYRWKRLKAALGLPDTMRMYDLRHFYATAFAGSGASEEELQKAMGHSTSTFTHQVYVELFREHQERVNAQMAERTRSLYGDITNPAQKSAPETAQQIESMTRNTP